MRLLPVSLLCVLFASTSIAAPPEQKLASSQTPGDLVDDDAAAEAQSPTIFNGVSVPPLPDIEGEKFNATVKEGYWMIKHHSPYCGHCLRVAPIWQTLYEYYYTSKPVPSKASVDDTKTSMNTFTAYYNFHFGNLDCVAFGTACTEHGVGAFPTFILYKGGEQVKKFTGAKDMKGLSDFVEGALESIRPGSRPIGGPALPKEGDTTAPEASIGKDGKKMTPTVSSDDKESKTKAPLQATPIKNTPTKAPKPLRTPNPLGTSISFTAEKFQTDVTMSQDPWFIKFYAPWCAHCQAMAPNWVQLAKEMKGKLNIGEVNCDQEARLCKDVRVRGYPTIHYFRGGERVEYDGLRGLGDFITYANKAIDIGGGVQDVNAAEFKELEEKEEVLFVYFYDHATTTEDFAALERLTLSLIGHAKLVKTNSAILADRYKITTWPRLLVSRDGRPTYYTALAPQDMRDFRKVLHWMQSVWLPIVPELTSFNSREIMDGKLVVLGILTRERSDEFIMAKKEIKSAALEWMDKQTINFQRERQELRDSKQLRIEEAEDRNDQRALRAAKQIRINMDQSDQKEVGFAWVDGVFWERWIRTTYGIEGAKDGEKVIINDEDQHRYWDTTISGSSIMASRTSILETIGKVVQSPPAIKPKSTVSSFEKFFFDIRGAVTGHKWLSMGVLLVTAIGVVLWGRRRTSMGYGFAGLPGFGGRRGGGYFRLDEKDGLLGGRGTGKVD